MNGSKSTAATKLFDVFPLSDVMKFLVRNITESFLLHYLVSTTILLASDREVHLHNQEMQIHP